MKNVALDSEGYTSIVYEVTDIGQNNHFKLVSSIRLQNSIHVMSLVHYMTHCKSLLKVRYPCSNNQMHM